LVVPNIDQTVNASIAIDPNFNVDWIATLTSIMRTSQSTNNATTSNSTNETWNNNNENITSNNNNNGKH
jgi:hypothetical protein